MRSAIFAAAAVMWLSGCGSTSGPTPYGPDTYIVQHNNPWGPGNEAKNAKTATKFCEKQGEVMIPVNSTSTRAVGGVSNANLTFRCLDPSDPEVHRPVMQPVPDTVIEDRR